MSIGKGFFVASSVYFYGYDEQPYTCLYENEDIVLFSFPYQGYKRHALMQLKDLRPEEWSVEAKAVHKKALTSLYRKIILDTESTGNYQHRIPEGSKGFQADFSELAGRYSGQGIIGDFDE